MSIAILAASVPWKLVHADDARDSSNPYGILAFLDWDHDWNNHFSGGAKLDKSVALIQQAGAGWVRIAFEWSDIEPEKGRFAFQKYDHILDVLDKHGIKTLGILCYNPAWRKAEWNAAPIPDDFIAYSTTTVAHFKGRVKYWEFWNEPDSKFYWDPQDDMTAYSALLKRLNSAVKAVDPSAQIVMGGMTESGPFAIRRVYQKAGKDSFDVVNIHPFVNPLKPNAVGTLKGIYTSLMRVMTEFGDQNKPIWFTELGCPGVKNPSPQNGWWEGISPNEDQQAKWVTTVYTNTLQWPGVQRVFWAFLRDTHDFFHSGVDDFGLVTEDFVKKPSYKAYQELKK